MKAVRVKSFGDAEQLYIGDWEKPQPQAKEVLVKSPCHRTQSGRYPATTRKIPAS